MNSCTDIRHEAEAKYLTFEIGEVFASAIPPLSQKFADSANFYN